MSSDGDDWWQPIGNAQFIRYGTVADLKMESGRIYRATWDFRGRCCAWWPQSSRRKNPIGLYEPIEFRVVAVGMRAGPADRPGY